MYHIIAIRIKIIMDAKKIRRRRDDAAKKKKTKSNVVENELRALKRKYYPGDGTSLQNGDVSLKSIADKKTKGKFKRAQGDWTKKRRWKKRGGNGMR